LQQLLDPLLVDAHVERGDVAGRGVLLLADRDAIDQAVDVLLGKLGKRLLGAHWHETLQHGFDRARLRLGHADAARRDGVGGGGIDRDLGYLIEAPSGLGRHAHEVGDAKRQQDKTRLRRTLQS
jgi:hypothetical protein